MITYIKYSLGLAILGSFGAVGKASIIQHPAQYLSFQSKYHKKHFNIVRPLVFIAGTSKYDHMINLPQASKDMETLHQLFSNFYGYTIWASCLVDKPKRLEKKEFLLSLFGLIKELKSNFHAYDALIFAWCGHSDLYHIFFSDKKEQMKWKEIEGLLAPHCLVGFSYKPKIFIQPKYAILKDTFQINLQKKQTTSHSMPPLYNVFPFYSEITKSPYMGSQLIDMLDHVLRKRSKMSLQEQWQMMDLLLEASTDQHERLVKDYTRSLGKIYLSKHHSMLTYFCMKAKALNIQLRKGKSIYKIKKHLYKVRKQQVTCLAENTQVNVIGVLCCFDLIFLYSLHTWEKEKEKRYKRWLTKYTNDPLHQACKQNNIEMVKLLIEKKHRERYDLNGFCAFHYAVSKGNIAIIKLLLNNYRGNLIDIRTEKNKHAFHIAAQYGQVDVIKLFIECYKVDIHTRMKNQKHVLHIAAQYGQVDVIRFLIEHCKVNRHIRTQNQDHVLHIAAQYGQTKVIRLLIDHYKVDKHTRTQNNKHALHIAARYGQNKVIKLLLDTYKVDLNIRGQHGGHALHYAIMRSQWHTITFLLHTYQANINVRDQYQRHLLHCAVNYNAIEMIDLLVKTYAIDLNIRGKNEKHALHFAAMKGHTQMLDLLINTYKVDVDARDQEGRHALHYAVQGGQLKAIDFLITKCLVYIHVWDRRGYTPLHIAAEANQKEAYTFLIRLGADEERKIGWSFGITAKELKKRIH